MGAWERAGTSECKWWRFKMNKLLFAVDTALVSDSEQKLCKLVNESLEYLKEDS